MSPIFNRKLKVLMFGWEFPPFIAGGLGMACYGMVKSLIKRGVEVTLILPKNITSSREDGLTIFGADFWKFCVDKQIESSSVTSVKTIRLQSPIEPYSFVNEPIELSQLSLEAIDKILTEQKDADLSGISKDRAVYGNNLIDEVHRYNQTAASIASSLDFDIIHCHDWLTFGAGVIAKEVSGKPLVCHVHATEFDRCPGNGNDQVRFFEQSGCQAADKVIAVSNYTKDILVNNYGIEPWKIDILHNGIDINALPPKPRETDTEAPKILFLGRVTYQKGPNYFLEAATKVLKFKPKAEFIIAGGGDLVPYLQGRTHELGISNSVTFTGMLKGDQVKEIYQSVDCFVLSSVSEPFGLTVLEALSHRLPVIISKQSGVSEVLKHVLRYDFWDVDRLASLILSVIMYPTLSKELKDRSFDDLYPITWDQVAGKLEGLYHKTLDESYGLMAA
ncbi:MAG: glycosyltransferase family 4 protein [Candidatus Caenarcaniphilales bacterium]|nr:glycosyltransferase family 4 protein [Candidatus Caenarcaniphilales bacterium]